MQIIEGIKSRRSIRAYTDQQISKTDLQEIIECWMHAPSARNQQAREFFIIQSPEQKTLLAQQLKDGKYQTFVNQANSIILTGFKQSEFTAPEFIQQDMWACTQNILLATHNKGIGAVRVGIYPMYHSDQSLNTLLNIPTEVTIFNAIALGYPDNKLPLSEKKCIKPEKIHRL